MNKRSYSTSNSKCVRQATRRRASRPTDRFGGPSSPKISDTSAANARGTGNFSTCRATSRGASGSQQQSSSRALGSHFPPSRGSKGTHFTVRPGDCLGTTGGQSDAYGASTEPAIEVPLECLQPARQAIALTVLELLDLVKCVIQQTGTEGFLTQCPDIQWKPIGKSLNKAARTCEYVFWNFERKHFRKSLGLVLIEWDPSDPLVPSNLEHKAELHRFVQCCRKRVSVLLECIQSRSPGSKTESANKQDDSRGGTATQRQRSASSEATTTPDGQRPNKPDEPTSLIGTEAKGMMRDGAGQYSTDWSQHQSGMQQYSHQVNKVANSPPSAWFPHEGASTSQPAKTPSANSVQAAQYLSVERSQYFQSHTTTPMSHGAHHRTSQAVVDSHQHSPLYGPASTMSGALGFQPENAILSMPPSSSLVQPYAPGVSIYSPQNGSRRSVGQEGGRHVQIRPGLQQAVWAQQLGASQPSRILLPDRHRSIPDRLPASSSAARSENYQTAAPPRHGSVDFNQQKLNPNYSLQMQSPYHRFVSDTSPVGLAFVSSPRDTSHQGQSQRGMPTITTRAPPATNFARHTSPTFQQSEAQCLSVPSQFSQPGPTTMQTGESWPLMPHTGSQITQQATATTSTASSTFSIPSFHTIADPSRTNIPTEQSGATAPPFTLGPKAPE